MLLVGFTINIQRGQLTALTESNKENFEIHQNTYNALVLSLIEKLLSQEMAEIRQQTEILREDLKSETRAETTREELKKIFRMQISDNWCQDGNEYKKITESAIYKQYSAFTKLIRYFDMISFYKLDENTAKALQFYYVWWKSFFETICNIFKEADKEVQPKHLTINPSWLTTVERLDAQMRKFNLPVA